MVSVSGYRRVVGLSGTTGLVLWFLGGWLGLVTGDLFNVLFVGLIASLLLAVSHVASYRLGELEGNDV